MNDASKPCSKLQAVRDALREELDATNTYETLKEMLPEYADVFDEIKMDEVNHSGRLLDIIMKMDAKEMEPFNRGLEQEDVNA